MIFGKQKTKDGLILREKNLWNFVEVYPDRVIVKFQKENTPTFIQTTIPLDKIAMVGTGFAGTLVIETTGGKTISVILGKQKSERATTAIEQLII